jgi:hypothetical protein
MSDNRAPLIKASGLDGLFIGTMLRTTSKALDLFEHMSFLYDPDWVITQKMSTIPLCFFYEQEESETHSADVASKKIVTYSSDTGLSAAGVQRAQLSAVADNIVGKPKTYRISCLVPAASLTNFFSPLTRTVEATVEAFAEQTGTAGTLSDTLQNIGIQSAKQVSSLVNTVLELLATLNASSSAKQITSSVLSTALKSVGISGNFFNALTIEYNKNSLAYMKERNHILSYKHWTDWAYKKVVITGLNLVKKGENSDFYEGTIDLTELPVTVISPSKNITTKLSAYYAVQQEAVASAAKGITDALGNF